MLKEKNSVIGASILIVILFLMQTSAVFATLTLEDVTTWYWTSNTYIRSVAVGDVDGDTQQEIVTGGYHWDGTRYVAQLCVWDGATLALEDVITWYWTGLTYIRSVAVGDVDGDTQMEIVTGGYFGDGARDNAQLCVWDGATLALEDVITWYWIRSTRIESVSVGDVDGDTQMEIVTGGYYYEGSQDYSCHSQLCVWDGATLTLENVKTWKWTGQTRIYSVAIRDVHGDGQEEIITGGCCSYSTAQLCVWDGATLTLENVKTWTWGAETKIASIAVGDVDGDTQMEIITGGYYWPDIGKDKIAQLVVWNGADLNFEDVTTWKWDGWTVIHSVAIADVNGDTQMEIITAGYHGIGNQERAQLCVWDGADLTLDDVETWRWVSTTIIYSVAVADVDGDTNLEIVTGGYYYDNTRVYAQLCVWE